MHDIKLANRGWCFWIPCFGSDSRLNPKSWDRISEKDKEDAGGSGNSWAKPLLKMREWSALVAGPKWKTFIRRFNKGKVSNQGKFHYDPLSYALNFDEGPGEDADLDDDRLNRAFSFRYASIPVSAKTSMDLGKVAPSFA